LTQQSRKIQKAKMKLQSQNIQEIKDIMKRLNLKIIGIDEREDSQLERPANIFNYRRKLP